MKAPQLAFIMLTVFGVGCAHRLQPQPSAPPGAAPSKKPAPTNVANVKRLPPTPARRPRLVRGGPIAKQASAFDCAVLEQSAESFLEKVYTETHNRSAYAAAKSNGKFFYNRIAAGCAVQTSSKQAFVAWLGGACTVAVLQGHGDVATACSMRSKQLGLLDRSRSHPATTDGVHNSKRVFLDFAALFLPVVRTQRGQAVRGEFPMCTGERISVGVRRSCGLLRAFAALAVTGKGPDVAFAEAYQAYVDDAEASKLPGVIYEKHPWGFRPLSKFSLMLAAVTPTLVDAARRARSGNPENVQRRIDTILGLNR